MRGERWQTSEAATWDALKPPARQMRRQATAAERVLWARLRNRALGVRIRRQHAVDRFILDFCCLDPKLAIEVDGEIHRSQGERDAERDARLQALGYRVLRFTNEEVQADPERVVAAVRTAIAERTEDRDRVP